ncbi:MAG: nucleoside transporter C-terminal domain-containing protein [Acidobacteriota bacterium]|nr:MAG: nucleoside permease nupX [Acidobacteriota bacterium]
MSLWNLVSALGLVAFAALAWLAGGCRRPVTWRPVLGSAGLMLVLALAVFRLPPMRTVLLWVNDAVVSLLDASREGALFLFGPLAVGPGESTASGEPSVGFVLAAQVLPAVVFFAAVMAGLYHLRAVQPVIRLLARGLRRTLRLSGAEALAAASNIVVGIEAALTVRPFLERMTRSELLTLLTASMATVASTTLAIYVMFLRATFPAIAGHLVSASVLSIPAAVLVSKLMLPEREHPVTLGEVPRETGEARHDSLMAALIAGSWDGLRLAAGIAGLLIAVLGLVGVLDRVLVAASGAVLGPDAAPVGIERLLSWLFLPLAFLLGIEPGELSEAGRLLGGRIVLTEVWAYRQLGEAAAAGTLGPRSVLVLSYALCGFAHFASLGIFVGGVAALAPSRREDLARLAWRALVGATLATLMTGALAGLFEHGASGVLMAG